MAALQLLFCILLVGQVQQAVSSKWTFSLHISSARCCSDSACESLGTCDDLFMAVCLRAPETIEEYRENCPYYIAGNSSAITDRELTSENLVDANWRPVGAPFIFDTYWGGIQVYIAMLRVRDSPPYRPVTIIVDELFVEMDSRAGSGETSVMDATGERGDFTASLSLRVECVAGYSGDTCNCLEGDCTPPAVSTITLLSPPGPPISTSMTSTSSIVTPTSSPSSPMMPSSTVSPSPPPSPSTLPPGGVSSNDSGIMVAVGAGLGGFVGLLLILLVLIVLCLFYKRRRDRKSYRVDLSHLNVEKQYTPTIPPRDIPIDGVSYTTVVHNESVNYDRDSLEKSEKIGEGLVYADLDHDTNNLIPTKQGLAYVEVDHDRATYTTFKKKSSLRKHKAPKPLPYDAGNDERIDYADIKREQPHKYANVLRPTAKPRKNLPQGEQNNYTTQPHSHS